MAERDFIKKIVEKSKKEMKAETFDDIDDFSQVNFWVSSGVPDIDWLMSTFGYSPGIMEVAGLSRCGKTTLLLHAIKEFLKIGGVPLVLSSERRENKDNAKRLGIDTSLVTRIKVKTIENMFDKAEEFIEMVRNEDKEVPILIGIDSLGATPTKAEINAKEDQEFMAVAAKVIKGRLRRITQVIDNEKICLFINNQTYKKIGKIFGKTTTSYGGEGLKFHKQLGFELSKIKTLKIGEKKIGQVTRFEITKSDFTAPEQFIDVPLMWGYGFVPSKEILELAEENDILERVGKKNGYRLKRFPKIYWKSEADFYRLMIEDERARTILNNLLIKVVHREIKIQRGIK